MNVQINKIIESMRSCNADIQDDIMQANIELINACANVLMMYENYCTTHRRYCVDGKYNTIPQLAKQYGIRTTTLRNRLKRGWTIEEAVTTPVIRQQVNNFSKCVPVFQYNFQRQLIKEFPSMCEASRSIGMEMNVLRNAVKEMDPIEQVGRFGFYLKTEKEE